ncbi:unnamed protein product [Chironomus riparius]|uniref:Uncharacterized protein n=1 Tax=Chironomus riparius TaxID=315576 RepID=A0A9N9RJS5_9DIPT|nr:unnamed protein product [Chironomus riparius]
MTVPVIILLLAVIFFLAFIFTTLRQRSLRQHPNNNYHIPRRCSNINCAQPVVQTTTCSNVIYTIPTNDPNRFSTNISTTLRHHYDLPPSYDQVVIQTVQTPSTPPTQPITAPTQLPERPPNYAEVPK